ncbi:hypothetical protein [Bordetella genomosp. 11]|uniref:Uncharacterized protein n=1 Tax=Bordetella genomosp. 11 TaxID=1416808 RepID=A0A261UF75_9BORD|nr:hypothetical protein [Bordetella genomosp. 11]OZI60564.1 hypothetical protein CAL28_14265 [Bordetella genomosp. 11]
MRSALHRPIALAIVLSAPLAAHAQTATTDGSATAVAAVAVEQVYIANTTNQEIVFFVESENTQRTEYHLAPGAAGTVHGEPGDKWLNIEMQGGANGNGAQARDSSSAMSR